MKVRTVIERLAVKQSVEVRETSVEPIVLRAPGREPIAILPAPKDDEWWRGWPQVPVSEQAVLDAASWETPPED